MPIINAGDGANQHPSQTMLDLYSIRKTQGKLEDRITMVGDLRSSGSTDALTHRGYSTLPPYLLFRGTTQLEYAEGVWSTRRGYR